MEELSKMNQINNLSFDIMHKEMNPTEQFVYADKIYQLSLQPELNENQQLLLEDIQDVASYHEDKNLLGLIWGVGQRIVNKSDIKRFSNDEIMQVLAAFAEWGLEQEED
ncbi:hypothetical protein P7D77_21685 [Enterococcus avium]|uniref:hypothetical protein n=1 Tax=Enterococcus avium TaxID=33945 RepID=UPI002890133C|nr:hypothetical protein [Enterococcus avium]MDT2400569.1 hypothetical protein [Enterococcus avium]